MRALPRRSPRRSGVHPKTVSGPRSFNTLDQHGQEETAAVYRRLLREGNQPPLPETALNLAGYIQLLTGRVQEAIELFTLNVEAFPRSANALDSLADGYLAAGDRARALLRRMGDVRS